MGSQASASRGDDPRGIIENLAKRGLRLWTHNGALRYLAPPGVLEDTDVAALREHREPILAILQSEGATWSAYIASLGQRSMWARHFLAASQTEGKDCSFNLLPVVLLNDDVNIETIQEAIDRVVARHEVLRTRYEMQFGALWQRVSDHLEIKIDQVNLGDVNEGTLTTSILEFGRRSFDISNGPCLRVAIFERQKGGSGRERLLAFCAHHIAVDHGSLQNILEEITQWVIWKKNPPPASQYRSFAAHQLSLIGNDRVRGCVDELRSKLLPLPTPPDLKWRSSRNLPIEERYPLICWSLTDRQEEKLHDLKDSLGLSLFGICLGLYASVIAEISDQSDILINVAATLRRPEDGAAAIGNFTNIVPFLARVNINAAIRVNLVALYKQASDALADRDIPFSMLVEAMGLSGSKARSPLSLLTFSWHREPDGDRGDGLGMLHPISRQMGPSGAMMLTGRESHGHVDFKLTYDCGSLSDRYAELVSKYMQAAVSLLCESPGASVRDVTTTARRGSFVGPPEGAVAPN